MTEKTDNPCDCLNDCGDDPGLAKGKVQPCDAWKRRHAPVSDSLLAELDWCINEGHSGPRTHAFLTKLRAAFQAPHHWPAEARPDGAVLTVDTADMTEKQRIAQLEGQLAHALANTDRAIAQTAEAISVGQELKRHNAGLLLALQEIAQPNEICMCRQGEVCGHCDPLGPAYAMRKVASAAIAEHGGKMRALAPAQVTVSEEFSQHCKAIANDESACREAYNNQYHKVRAEVGFNEWRSVWRFLLICALPSLREHKGAPESNAPVNVPEGLTPMLLANAAFCIECHADVPVEKRQSIIDKLLAASNILSAAPAAPVEQKDAIHKLIAVHTDLLESNPYCYFELAYTRYTGWMAWLCTNSREHDENRKVIAKGQGDTPEEACREAVAATAQPKEGE